MIGAAFHAWWIGSLLVLTALAMLIGHYCVRANGKTVLGILIDGRGRFSLTHFQAAVWTLLILSTLIAVLIVSGDSSNVQIDATLLGLMGISAGSAVLGTGVKAAKDAGGSGARVARIGEFTLSDGTTRRMIGARFSQIWLEEEGDFADRVVSITKFQNFIFTLVLVGIYCKLTVDAGGLPKLPESVVWLIGISHAGYVGGKVPNKS
jgi:hypothetical protein